MNEEQMKAWVADPNRADTLPFGFYEPAYRKGITGAALVVRGVVYFRNGHMPNVRAALVECFEQYNATIVEYSQALARALDEKPPKDGPLRWFYTEGEQPMPIDKAPGFKTLATTVPADEALVVQMTSADHKLATGFYDFGVFVVADWKSTRSGTLDVLDFTFPRAFLEHRPGVFQALFAAFCEALPTVHGHAGYAVNLPPMEQEANEATEYSYARRYGPGIDVGDPMGYSTVRLTGKIKTVDWIVALDADLVRATGGASSLTLPPDWYVRQPLGDGGLIIQAGVAPQSGISAGPGKPPLPPPAYVLLNAALHPIVAEKMDILQSGTLDSTAPLLNTTVATEAWLKRFDLPPDRITEQWRELHKTPTVTDSKPAIAANLHRLRQAMGLPDDDAPNSMGYGGGSPG
ncbi:hypothetical protein BTM_1768 [Burkholderia thailandensis 34]|uniref:DUF3396 domain-containing protein n=1 Tax=Burkholderia thailandensis TaxID=57975 RepID=UPI0005D8AC8F|nr:DUF3396 domain-containing protein [Burkholderia thailandensis]AJY29395.1 hypothetical protein BTM_1768 [Burkholderia thailandensis 34]AOJ55308.1 hypothetical protein AQ477_01415 [Burkholderia thailandensis]KXF60690.1 hypothetical protein AQ476_04915 [Burkholderia thailandensis]PNE75252.1 DUF3396 domain-containing protein [Burkholderia thailandensis]